MHHPTCLTVAALAAAFTLGQAAAPVPELVSRRAAGLGPAVTGNGPSHDAGFAGGGRFVVFTSGAAGLVADDANGPRLDVFRRDLAAGVTELVSRGPDGQPWGDAEAFGQSVSADGTKVAFVRQTLRPAAGSSLLASDVYVRDLAAGTTTLVSVRADGPGPGNGASGYGVISADGRFVAFESVATDVAGGADANGATDVFLRDLTAGTTQRLSNRAGSGDAGNGLAHTPQVSADGAVVVFHSSASDLVEPLVGNLTDLYVWQRADGRVRRVTLPGPAGDSGVRQLTVINVVLSGDGRYLAFRPTWAGGDGLAGVWWLDLETGTQTRVAEVTGSADAQQESGSGPVMSADGRTLAFTLAVTNDAVVGQRIHLWNADTGLHTLEELVVTLPPAGGEPPTSESPVLNADATKLAFLSLGPVPGTEVTEGGEYRLFVRTLATGHTVALPAGNDGQPAHDLAYAEFSPDGGRLLFQSESALGFGQDANATFDVFVYEFETQETTLVSVAAGGIASATPEGSSSLLGPAVTADGRYVLFTSSAADLVSGDTNEVRDAFRHDRQTRETKIVSSLPDGTPAGGGAVLDVSPDGRLVLFMSIYTGLAEGDTNQFNDAYLKDMETGALTLVSSKDGNPPASGNAEVTAARMSADGRYVVFESRATDLTSGITREGNVFLRDVAGGKTHFLSQNNVPVDGITMDGNTSNARITPDGTAALFVGNRNAWRYDRLAGVRTRLTMPNPSGLLTIYDFSPSGRWLFYQISPTTLAVLDFQSGLQRLIYLPNARASSLAQSVADNGSVAFVCRESLVGEGDTNGVKDVYFYDYPADEVRLASRGVEGIAPLGGHSEDPQLTPDGRFIVFRSWATNLVADDLNNTSDVFLHDTLTGQTTLLSASPPTGRPGNWMSITPAISADGRVAVFASGASDLVPGDRNGFGDIFAVALPAAPAPLVLTQVAAGQGGARIRFQWVGNPGVRYAVRVTGNLNGPWETVGGELLGTGEPLSFEEPEAGAPPNDTGRYFQVIELP